MNGYRTQRKGQLSTRPVWQALWQVQPIKDMKSPKMAAMVHLDRFCWGHSWLLCLETWSCPIDQVGSANPFLTVCIKKQSPGPWIKAFTTQVVWFAKSKYIIVSEAVFVCFGPMLLCCVQYWTAARIFHQSVQYHNRISEVSLSWLFDQVLRWRRFALPGRTQKLCQKLEIGWRMELSARWSSAVLSMSPL